MEPERVTARQIEAARRAITRHMKRQGRVWIRVFPDVPVPSKPTEVRMGKGKGSVEYWAATRCKPGRIMFEIDGVPGPRGRAERSPRRCQAAGQDEGRCPPGRGTRIWRASAMAKTEDLQGQDRRPARRTSLAN